MKYTTLSTTDLRVSKICLGTMSYGAQVSEQDAFEQMDMAIDMGVNFFDTAEMYAIPPSATNYGKTETIIGKWLDNTGNRDKIVLATKVMGPNRYPFVRDGSCRLDKKNIEAAINESLKRLKADSIDLYQLHWPDRHINWFGQRGYIHNPNEQVTPIEETLNALKDIQKSGKVRYFGLSNETPWGTMQFLQIAKEHGYPRMVSIQNVYNLLNRHYEINMTEISHRENIGLLSYSPLGFGVLGGRYFDGQRPQGGRFTLYPKFADRYHQTHVTEIAKEYQKLAKNHNLTLPQLSLAFVNRQPFITSNIIGASNIEQLREDIETIHIELSNEVLKEIDKIHERYPNPCS
ncbi:MAG: aldo/keto reductase [Leptospiraceae bacterium]|nr:aldo/keto reductase [Leptospiraceae bacterium]MCP5493865.1 aldo/keto reductase [Leptospiraceae bacterium]